MLWGGIWKPLSLKRCTHQTGIWALEPSLGMMANTMDSEAASSSEFLVQSSMKWDANGRDEFNGELELSLGLSLGGSIGKAKEKDKDKDKEGTHFRNLASGKVQPCLRIIATGNLHGVVEKDGSESMDNVGTGKEGEKQQLLGIETTKTRNPEGKSFRTSIQEIWKNLQKDGKPVPPAAPLSRSLSSTGPFKEFVSLSLPNGSTTKAVWPHHTGQQPFNANSSGIVQNGAATQRILRTCSLGATASVLVPPSAVLHRQTSLDVLQPDQKQEGTQTAMQKEILEQQRKREVHAMRRQEARKKREEKQQKKARRDEGKSILQSKTSLPFPTSCSAIASTLIPPAQGNKWILTPQTNQPQMDPREEGKNLLESQRSLQRDKDRAMKECDARSEREMKIRQKVGKGNLGALACNFALEANITGKAGIPEPTEISSFMERQASGKFSTPTRNRSSLIKGNIAMEDKNSMETCENRHKSSNSVVGEVETMDSSNQPSSGEIPVPGNPTSTSHPGPTFSVLPMHYPLQMPPNNTQCMPLPIGFSFPYMMPFWTPATQSTGSEPSKCNASPASSVFQPVPPHTFPSFQMPVPGALPNWLPVLQSRAVPAPAPIPGPSQFAHASRASLGRSSSVIPDQESGSSEGASSNDTKSQSSASVDPSWKGFQPLPGDPSDSNTQGQTSAFSEVNTCSKLEPPQYIETLEKVPSTRSQCAVEIPSSATSDEKQMEALCKKTSHFESGLDETKQSSSGHSIWQHNSKGEIMNKSTSDTMDQDRCKLKPGMACPQSSGGNGSLPTLHWVSTTGTGPNGITISGILSSYSRSQVRIVCVCHGTQMSPAEFVQHAGGTDLSNPERNIVVSPIPIGISATSAHG